jgi:hypothetical protein
VLSRPKDVAQQLGQFLDIPLDVDAMIQQVDASLYRNRTK